MSEKLSTPLVKQVKRARSLNKSLSEDLEVKDAQIIFDAVWQDLEKEHQGRPLIFPREIHWLNGAPGAGKGTHTQTLMHYRGLDAGPIIVSDLLQSREAKKRKDMGLMVRDREVISLVFSALLDKSYESGVVVDGYPRTRVQVASVRLLYQKLQALRAQIMDQEDFSPYPRSQFHVVVLFVDENESIRRQLKRGKKSLEKNRAILASGEGKLLEVRPTDLEPAAARRRYLTFKDQTYETLKSLSKVFPYHYIDAHGNVEAVRERVIAELKYQSSLELEEDTFNLVSSVPLADTVGTHAREQLVRRLDAYQRKASCVFKEVVDLLLAEFIPLVRRHAFSGHVVVHSENKIFQDSLATAIFLDVLSERGYRARVEVGRKSPPSQAKPPTPPFASVHIQFDPPCLRHHVY